jgi:hypothetical protein
VEMCGNTGRHFHRTQHLTEAGNGTLAARRNATSLGAMSACSACAGDYEDPDRTAWPAQEEKAEAAEREAASEFPDRVPDRAD